jgi:general secretion pathway protein G
MASPRARKASAARIVRASRVAPASTTAHTFRNSGDCIEANGAGFRLRTPRGIEILSATLAMPTLAHFAPAHRNARDPRRSSMFASKAAPGFTALALCSLAAPIVAQSPEKSAPKSVSTTATTTAPTNDAQATISRLVPATAFCIIEAPSLDALNAAVNRMRRATEPEAKDEIKIDDLLTKLEVQGRAELLDHKRPIAVCLSLDPELLEPVPTFILPVTSTEEFLKSLPAATEKPGNESGELGERAKPIALENYVGVTHLAKYSAADAPRALAANMLPGIVSARVDLERLFESIRPIIDPILAQAEGSMASASASMPGVDAEAFAKSYMDGLRAFIDSAETLDLATALQGDRVDVILRFTALEKSALAEVGSKSKTGVDALSKYLDPDASLAMLLGLDMASIMKRFQPMMDAMLKMYPEPMRASFQSSMVLFEKMYPLFGPGMAVSFDFTPAGMRGSLYIQPTDSKALLDLYAQAFQEMKFPGITVQRLEPATVEGLVLTQFHLTVDAKAVSEMTASQTDPKVGAEVEGMMKKIYGPDGVRIALAVHENRMVQVIGGDEAYLKRSIGALKDGRKGSSDVQPLVDRIGGFNPCFLTRLDVGRLVPQVMGLVPGADAGASAASADAKPPPSAPVAIWGGVDGRVWHGGASWDMARVVAASKQAFETPASGSKISGAMRGKARADILAIETALKDYAINNGGKYPDVLAVLVVPDVNGHAYLASKKVPTDPWGREYLYEPPTPSRAEPRVYTLGKDGQVGGEGDDADIDNSMLENEREK